MISYCANCWHETALGDDGLVLEHTQQTTMLEITFWGPRPVVMTSHCVGSGKPPMTTQQAIDLLMGTKYGNNEEKEEQ